MAPLAFMSQPGYINDQLSTKTDNIDLKSNTNQEERVVLTHCSKSQIIQYLIIDMSKDI